MTGTPSGHEAVGSDRIRRLGIFVQRCPPTRVAAGRALGRRQGGQGVAGAGSRSFGVRQGQQMPSVIVFHPGQSNAGRLAAA